MNEVALERSHGYGVAIAMAALIIAVAGLLVGSVSIYTQQRSDHRRTKAEQAARIANCVSSNNSRYGGSDYTRPLLRAYVLQNPDFVRAELAKEKLPLSLANVADLPQINCKTGEPMSLPKGAIQP